MPLLTKIARCWNDPCNKTVKGVIVTQGAARGLKAEKAERMWNFKSSSALSDFGLWWCARQSCSSVGVRARARACPCVGGCACARVQLLPALGPGSPGAPRHRLMSSLQLIQDPIQRAIPSQRAATGGEKTLSSLVHWIIPSLDVCSKLVWFRLSVRRCGWPIANICIRSEFQHRASSHQHHEPEVHCERFIQEWRRAGRNQPAVRRGWAQSELLGQRRCLGGSLRGSGER